MAVPYKRKRDKNSRMVPPWRRRFWVCHRGPSRWAPLTPPPRVLLSSGSLRQQAPKGRSPWRYPTTENETKMTRRYRHGDGAFGPEVPSVSHEARGPLQQAPKGRSPWRYLTTENETKMARRYRHGDGAFGPAIGAPPDGRPALHSRGCSSHPEPSCTNRLQKVDLHGGTLQQKTKQK